jgi:hypothetical protein
MINYKIIEHEDTTEIIVFTQGKWGTICFAWEKSNYEFTLAVESQGIEYFAELLYIDPNTAYQIFINGI